MVCRENWNGWVVRSLNLGSEKGNADCLKLSVFADSNYISLVSE